MTKDSNIFYAGIDPSKLYPGINTAEILGIQPQTLAVWRLTNRENLPVTRVGRHCKYLGEDIIAYLKSKRSSEVQND